jgi:hypothetical protein
MAANLCLVGFIVKQKTASSIASATVFGSFLIEQRVYEQKEEQESYLLPTTVGGIVPTASLTLLELTCLTMGDRRPPSI